MADTIAPSAGVDVDVVALLHSCMLSGFPVAGWVVMVSQNRFRAPLSFFWTMMRSCTPSCQTDPRSPGC